MMFYLLTTMYNILHYLQKSNVRQVITKSTVPLPKPATSTIKKPAVNIRVPPTTAATVRLVEDKKKTIVITKLQMSALKSKPINKPDKNDARTIMKNFSDQPITKPTKSIAVISDCNQSIDAQSEVCLNAVIDLAADQIIIKNINLLFYINYGLEAQTQIHTEIKKLVLVFLYYNHICTVQNIHEIKLESV